MQTALEDQAVYRKRNARLEDALTKSTQEVIESNNAITILIAENEKLKAKNANSFNAGYVKGGNDFENHYKIKSN